MRIILCLLVVIVAGGFLFHQHKEETKPAPEKSAAVQENNPHDWMKNSLDRAGEVKKQVAQQRKEAGDIYGR